MQNIKVAATVKYMVRHLMMANITDPLSASSRSQTPYELFFSGTGALGQINYLDRKIVTNGNFMVKVNGVTRTPVVDYVVNSSTLTITWTAAYTPPSGTDNIQVNYEAVQSWIYDDHPFINANTYPRMTVSILPLEYETPGMGVYQNYTGGPGNLVTATVKIIVRNRQGTQTYTYGGVKYKNYDLIDAILTSVVLYVNTNRQLRPWKFYDWEIKRDERVETEEDVGMFRGDVTIRLRYYDYSSP
jgi:hypothetical protein